ncbi:MAG TPA: VTT domain-containing protein [Bryobacteraceae bacterium]|nr:VTT domain-containing protein [Bryobacteraceae bacterium]
MTILSSLSSAALWSWMRRLGPFGLLLVGIFDNDPVFGAPPGTIDLFVILLCAGSRELWALYALTATVGEVIGGYMAYRIAEKGGEQILNKRIGQARAAKFYKLFEKHGFVAVFAGAAAPPPFPFTSLLISAGIMQYPRKKFLVALACGRTIRFFTEAFLGRTYGPQMIAFYSGHYRAAMNTLIALAVIAGIAGLIYYKNNRARKQSANA